MPSTKQLEQKLKQLTGKRDRQKEDLAKTTLALAETKEAVKAAKATSKPTEKPAKSDEAE